MTLLTGPQRATLPARIVRTLRPWWPRTLHVEDPVDAALIDWLAPARLVYAGLLLIAVVFGGLLFWQGSTALEKGALSEATVEPLSHRKVVSSQYPGIVREVLVKENEKVRAGQTLLVLDATEAEANAATYAHARLSEMARAARASAILDGRDEPTWPTELLDTARQDPEAATTLETNRRLFAETRQTLNGQLDLVRTQIQQVTETIASNRATRDSLVEQRALIHQELAAVQTLMNQGLERKPKLLELQRNEADLDGQTAAREAEMARAEIQMRELTFRMTSVQADQRDKAAKELSEAQARAIEMADRLRAQRNVVERKVLTAPQTGTVIGMRTHTVGAAIQANQTLLEIVPDDDTLMLRVMVLPTNIADVGPGTKARVTIEGASPSLRHLTGTVVDVSPDLIPHPRLPHPTYIADVEVHTDKLRREAARMLRPGMAARVKLVTGTRSVWTYMTESLFDAVRSHDRLIEERGGGG